MAKFTLVKVLLIVPLPMLVIMQIVFFRRFFYPWLSRARKESSRVAELLAQLSKELNVETLLLEAMGHNKKAEEEEKERRASQEEEQEGKGEAVKSASVIKLGSMEVPLAPLAAKSAKLRRHLSRKLSRKVAKMGTTALRMLEGGAWADAVARGGDGGEMRDTEDDSYRPSIDVNETADDSLGRQKQM